MELNQTNHAPNHSLKHDIEALLFFFNEPVSYDKLCKLLDCDNGRLKQEINLLKDEYMGRGLQVIDSTNEVQLVALIQNEELLNKISLSNHNSSLTPAMVETLAIISYLGSCIEDSIDSIRGVKSSRTLKKLLRRGYVELINKKYEISAEAMKQLNIDNLNNLPNRDSLKLKLESLANHDVK